MKKVVVKADQLEFEPTNHGVGLKKIFIRSSDTASMLMQFAAGKLLPGQKIPEHSHDTMEEIFYFLSGEGTYTVDDVDVEISPSTAILIPAGAQHSLEATGTIALEFIYAGIATK